MAEQPEQYYTYRRSTPDIEAEIQRLLHDLKPQLRNLLSGKEKFRIEIHGKPGARCTYSITRQFE